MEPRRDHWIDRQHVLAPEGRRVEALADQLYLMAHTEHDGTPLIADAPLRRGLAAGMLGELVLSRQGVAHEGRLFCWTDGWLPPGLIRELWAFVLREPTPLPLTEWVRHLAAESVEDVRARLRLDGWLETVHERRRLLGTRTFYRPPREHASRAILPAIQLASGLAGDLRALSPERKLLGCLASAMGLIDASPFLLAHQGRGRDRARELRDVLLADPDLAQLAEVLLAAETAIGDAVLARP